MRKKMKTSRRRPEVQIILRCNKARSTGVQTGPRSLHFGSWIFIRSLKLVKWQLSSPTYFLGERGKGVVLTLFSIFICIQISLFQTLCVSGDQKNSETCLQSADHSIRNPMLISFKWVPAT